MSRTSAFAGAVAGLALWVTGGALDAIDGSSAAIRVAMLPPMWLALALIVAGAAAAVALTCIVAWLAHGRWRQVEAADTDVVLPLFASALLALPYLPWLADVLPAWTALASPFVRVAWLVIAGLVLRAAIRRIAAARSAAQQDSSAAVQEEGMRKGFSALLSLCAPEPLLRRTSAGQSAAIFLVTTLVCGGAALRLAGTPIFPGGDEPHYLVIAQSLWRDGDLRIENNHRRGDTFEYFARPLKPDYLTRGVDREIYSIHPVGVAYLLAPVYALGGYRGVVVFLILLASAAATMAWRLAVQRVGIRAATFGWAACALTAPWVFNSFTVYPEVPAAVSVIVAFALALSLDRIRNRRRLWLSMFAGGVAIATLPWLSSKYALMGAALGLMTMARLWLPGVLADAGEPAAAPWSMRDRLLASVAAAAMPVVSGIGWLAFFKAIWGTWSPSAPYGTQHAMDLSYLIAGGPGLFFDQEYGVVAAAPVLLLGLGGLVGMLRRGGRDTRLAIEIALIGVSLLVTVAAFHIWWGGTAAVGRPLIAGLILLVIPCAWQFRAWSASTTCTAAAWLLLLASLGLMATLALAQEGLLLVAERDGTSRLLSYWAPAWRLWSIAPSFVIQPSLRALLITAVWIAGALAAVIALGRLARATPDGRAGLVAASAAFLVLSGVAIAVAPINGRTTPTRSRLADRARQPLLDDFDRTRRPIALRFDPLRRVEASALPTWFAFTADSRVSGTAAGSAPGAATLLLGARWAWPAGDYEVEISALAPWRGELGLQAGRVGPPLATWMVDEPGGTRWKQRFSLPIDVSFAGFKGSPAMSAARPTIRIRPIVVVDTSRRLPPADVVQSRAFGAASVFFHDDNADPEPAGFWTRRDRTTSVSIARTDGSSVALRVRSGPAAVRLRIRSVCAPSPVRPCTSASEDVDLTPNTSRDVALGTTGPLRVEIETRGGFVPAEVDRASRDIRGLGCWIEITNGR
jgi:hypothetical protein